MNKCILTFMPILNYYLNNKTEMAESNAIDSELSDILATNLDFATTFHF